jgi:hypothetical protein
MRKTLAIALAALSIGVAAPSRADPPTDPTDIAYIRELIADNVPLLKSEDDMVKRGRGIASYLSQHADEDGVATVYQNNEHDGFAQRDVTVMILDASRFYISPMVPGEVFMPLLREYVGTHPEMPGQRHFTQPTVVHRTGDRRRAGRAVGPCAATGKPIGTHG